MTVSDTTLTTTKYYNFMYVLHRAGFTYSKSHQLMVSDELCHMLNFLSSQHQHHPYKHRVNTVYTEWVQHLLGQQFRLVIHCIVSDGVLLNQFTVNLIL